MKKKQSIKTNPPHSVEELEHNARNSFENIMKYCKDSSSKNEFKASEAFLKKEIYKLACIFLQIFLYVFEEKLDYKKLINNNLFYHRPNLIGRTVKTFFGPVQYWRTYAEHRNISGGYYPLDAVLGLTGDGFSQTMISLAARLATRMSYGSCQTVMKYFNNYSPSTEAIEALVIGLGKYTKSFMATQGEYEDDGEILVIEIDGKATPTATESELNKRRGKRKGKEQLDCPGKCKCKRHRKSKKIKSKRKKKGDKSKNGRSTTIVVMYTLLKGKDGKLHGPINKKIWASYESREDVMEWTKEQAERRGFGSDSGKQVHIALDGELCLQQRLQGHFPDASFVLDIRHLEEKIWEVGHKLFPEGSKELEEWVRKMRKYLYAGKASNLLKALKRIREGLVAPRKDISSRKSIDKLMNYMEPRIFMMNYSQLIEDDLPIASGIVEGAARYVVGERLDCSGMRWIPRRAESLLQLRCIELNEDWEEFFDWVHKKNALKMQCGERIMIRETNPKELDKFKSDKKKVAV
jgi:hypothetical protein